MQMTTVNKEREHVSYIAAVPDDLLETVLMSKFAAPEDLCRLACVSLRFKRLSVSSLLCSAGALFLPCGGWGLVPANCHNPSWCQLQRAQRIWLSLFIARWGVPSGLTRRAAELAKGWTVLYKDKAANEKQLQPNGWQQPCKWELDAALEKLTKQPYVHMQLPVAVVFLLDGSGSVNQGAQRTSQLQD